MGKCGIAKLAILQLGKIVEGEGKVYPMCKRDAGQKRGGKPVRWLKFENGGKGEIQSPSAAGKAAQEITPMQRLFVVMAWMERNADVKDGASVLVLPIGRWSNKAVLPNIPCPKECRIVGQLLVDHALNYALTAIADVPVVYIQQFWKTVRQVSNANETIHFMVDKEDITYTMDMFRASLKLPVESPKQPFIPPARGYQGPIKKVSAFFTKNLAQPWQTMFKVFNRCLTSRLTGHNQTKINVMQIFHDVINRVHVDYASLLWWDFLHCVMQKKNVIQYPHFTKLIIADLMEKCESISKRLEEDYHTIKDDSIETQVYEDYEAKYGGVKVPTIQPEPQKPSTTTPLPPSDNQERDDIIEAAQLSLALDKTTKVYEEQQNVAVVEKKILEEDVEKLVDSEEKSSGSDFADMVLLSDEDSGDRTRRTSSSEIRTEKMQTPIPTPLEKVNEALKDIVPKLATTATIDLINDNLPRIVANVVKKDRESSKAVVPALISQDTSTATTSDLQQQLYLMMKSDLQAQVVDLELWDVLKAKIKATIKDMLSNQYRDAKEYAYHLEQAHNNMENQVVWESRQEDLKQPQLEALNENTKEKKYVLLLHKIHETSFLEEDIEEKTIRWMNSVGLIYYNIKEEKRVMDLGDIAKFCDDTLEKVLSEVRLKIFETEYMKKNLLLGELDLKIMKSYEREIMKRLKHRKQMRRWESFVNGRPILQTMKHQEEEIRKCDSCQIHAPVQKLPKTLMTSMMAPCPFYQWGLYILGPLPEAPGRVEFIIIAIDNFTKWIEAKPLAKTTSKETLLFNDTSNKEEIHLNLDLLQERRYAAAIREAKYKKKGQPKELIDMPYKGSQRKFRYVLQGQPKELTDMPYRGSQGKIWIVIKSNVLEQSNKRQREAKLGWRASFSFSLWMSSGNGIEGISTGNSLGWTGGNIRENLHQFIKRKGVGIGNLLNVRILGLEQLLATPIPPNQSVVKDKPKGTAKDYIYSTLTIK
ncbi:retrovirus-related pol polyprotein from transposon TNT 1-94 [Tanacetum coccineum]|uniref:Retrovirus-related pol polyprotein from transposon TNT 1-94 n=1 Tax=Tanacetum coccineum TaxID=301880 RepID=A0ABQ5DY34_9ASTR